MLPPCKDCPGRHVGCHSECPQYAEFAKSMEAIREERDKDLLVRLFEADARANKHFRSRIYRAREKK